MWTPWNWYLERRRLKRHFEGVRELLAELDEEFGPLPEEELEKGEREWQELERRLAAKHRR